MGIVGVRCIKGQVTMADHLICQATEVGPPCGIEQTVLNMIVRPKLERIEQGVVFSPSSLQRCHRQHSLQADHDWYVDVEKAYPMARGDIIHAGLALEPGPPGTLGAIRELRMHWPVQTEYGMQKFSGQVDLIVLNSVDPDGTLHVKILDYKSKNEIKHELVEANRRHVYQVNDYALLVTRALPDYLLDWTPGELKHGNAKFYLNVDSLPEIKRVAVDELSIFYLSSRKTRTFTSRGFLYTQGKMRGEVGEDKHWRAYVPHEFEELELAPIPFFDLAYTERIIKTGIEEQIRGEQELAAPLEGDDAKLMCQNCPVRLACYEVGKAQGYSMEDQMPYISKENR